MIDPFPLQNADQCVLCGMCLAQCPTYLKTHDEGESPRGRIALLIALAQGNLSPSPRLRAHLENCLVCRACERICPAKVPYGSLIDAGRALLLQTYPSSLFRRWIRRIVLDGLVTHPRRLRGLGWIGYLLQRSGLTYLAPLFGLGALNRRLPTLILPRPLKTHYSARGVPRGRLALFTGCLSDVLDRSTLLAALRVLTHLGYEVDVPKNQGCCGALHLHSGDSSGARRLFQHNQHLFSGPWDCIITTASGCGAVLVESLDSIPVKDINPFLTKAAWPEDVNFRPLTARVAVHDPCSLVNGLGCEEAPYALLRRIPGITLFSLPGNTQCCGGAGAHILNQSPVIRALLADKIAAIRALAPDILVTSNLGCALHLAAGIREAKFRLEVMHPIALVARQIGE